MRVLGRIGVLAIVLVAAAAPAAARADTPWSIGAAKVDTTPPAFNSAQDLADFPEVDVPRDTICPRMTFNGPRLWRFEEPYTDTDSSGDFNYPDNGSGVPTPEPFCDYNHNHRWDGIYLSGGVNHLAKTLHDPIDARAVTFSDGSHNVVLVSVVAQGIFENYIAEARGLAETTATQPAHASCGHIDEMVISSNHNESSPDTVGIYGAPADPAVGAFGLNSGIDEYYMDWLDQQMANAAVESCDNRQAASLHEVDFPVPPDMEQEIPGRFPTRTDGNATTPSGSQPAAIDPKVRVLQARDASGDPIFTMMNLADHNQDIGHSDSYEQQHAFSSDWPGYFHSHLEERIGGMAMFLAADIGSMEDLITVPRILTGDCDNGHNGCFPQVDHTGDVIAGHVADALANAESVPFGSVSGERMEFCTPLENNLFRAAFQAGLFGERHAYTNCVDTGSVGNEVHTSVAVLNVGPALQFLVHPGEEFPGLVLGGPWGIEDASCPTRENPPVPTWHAKAKHRFQVGLGDDLIGYLKPAWSFLYDTPGGFTPTDCTTDSHNHSHALEDESVGWTAGNLVAQNLSDLLDAQGTDPAADIRVGRYVKADGSLTDAYTAPADQGTPGHFPTDAVAVWLAAPGSTTLNATPGQPDSGTIVALKSVGSFGSREVDANGSFMDFDGAEQPGGPDVSTRGMLVPDANGGADKRYYVDVYPALTVTGTLGPGLPYSGYARPISATPATMALVPAYKACTSANSTHAAPLAAPSCNPPVQTSDHLTVGTPDANGKTARSVGRVTLTVAGESPINFENGDQADVLINASLSDVFTKPGLTDYTGELRAVFGLRITDRFNGAGLLKPATVTDTPLAVNLSCSATGGPEGSVCNVATTADAVLPGVTREGKRAVWELSDVKVFDGGGDGDADTSGDNTLFATQGAFVP